MHVHAMLGLPPGSAVSILPVAPVPIPAPGDPAGSAGSAGPVGPATPIRPKPPRQRGAVACRRCRRLRTKCFNAGAQPPCHGCVAAGPEAAASCAFPTRGERDTDREYRRRTRVALAGGGDSASCPDTAGRPAAGHVTLVTGPASSFTTPITAPAAASAPAPERTRSRSVPSMPWIPPPTSTSTPFRLPMQSRSRRTAPSPRRLPPPAAGGLVVDPTTWPPHDEIIEGFRSFVTCYFQLGFLHKALFLEELVQQRGRTSPGPNSLAHRFLMLCILAISSRFTPALARRYGSPVAATDYFLGLAQALAPTEMYAPTLERTQAFFLLSIAEWGNADRDRSAIDMAVAVRMAILLRLHREDTYRGRGSLGGGVSTATTPSSTHSPSHSHSHSHSTVNIPLEQVVRAESARRTFWMIYSQENLHAGSSSPSPLSLQDTTALLPCDEADFVFGTVPAVRAALPGTPPAQRQPHLATHPQRCLFATLIQAHSLWGRIARQASLAEESPRLESELGLGPSPEPGSGSRPGPESEAGAGAGLGSAMPGPRSSPALPLPPPWDPHGPLATATADLRAWEAGLPPRHRWSLWNLRGWRAEGLHLAYLSVVMVLRLSNIVVRRLYLDQLIAALQPADRRPTATATEDSPATAFWQHVSYDLFDNVVELHEQVVAYFRIRTPDEGFPAILVFCIYMCGSLASYLWHNPFLCPHVSSAEAEEMALSALRILGELHTAWPTSARWQQVLHHITRADPHEEMSAVSSVAGDAMPVDSHGTEASSEPLPNAHVSSSHATSSSSSDVPFHGHSDSVAASPAADDSYDGRPLITMFPDELFNAALADYLDGSLHYGLLDLH